MKNKCKNSRSKDVAFEGSVLLTDSLLDAGTNMAADVLKESIVDTLGELAVDTASSFLPGVSGAVASYKRKKAEKNIITFVKLLHEKHETVLENLHQQTEINRQNIDEMMHHIINHVREEIQADKVEFMVTGFIRLTEHEEFTEDFVLLYYDVLKQLRMVDISVLKLYYNNTFIFDSDTEEERETFQGVMERHGLSYEQYLSVRENLKRLGLLEVKVEDNLEDDLKALKGAFSDLQSHYDRVLSGKRAKKIREPKLKLKMKEKIRLNKFGRDFYEFFIDRLRY